MNRENSHQKESIATTKIASNVLLITESLPLAEHIRGLLLEHDTGWQLLHAGSLADAWQLLPDCFACLLDAETPGALSMVVRANQGMVTTPVVWLGNDDRLIATAMLKAGAIDCLSTNSIDWPLLSRSLRHAAGKMEMGRQLDESSKRLQEFTESTTTMLADFRDGVLITEKSGRLLYVNNSAGEILGCDPLRLVGGHAPCAFPGDEGAYEIELTAPFRVLDVQVSDTTWNGIPAQLLILRDITDKRLLESELRRAFRALNATENGITIADACIPGRPLVYVNPAFERITGFDADEIMGKNCQFLHSEDAATDSANHLYEAIARGESCHATMRNRRKDGTSYWNEIHISPIRDIGGNVTHYIGIHNDVTERVESREKLEWLATHHAICGLLNQYGLAGKISEILPLAQEFGRTINAFWINFVGFHSINGQFGYEAGDHVIAETARRLLEIAGNGGVVARIGGDEFVIVTMTDGCRDEANDFANLIHASLSQPFVFGGMSLQMKCRVGICQANGDLSDSMSVVRNADIAMHHAKPSTQNPTMWFSDNMARTNRELTLTKNELQHALEKGQLSLHYQLQFDALNGKVVGMEALARWQHPTRGLLAADDFIPVAEKTGQINEISNFILETACRDAAILRACRIADFPIAINISCHELRSPDFIKRIEDALRIARLPADRLEIELRESVISDATQDDVERIDTLRRMGIRIVMDNFGRGASDLIRLRRLPANKIKLDHSFVREVFNDSRDAAIVRGMVSIAHDLKMVVAAVNTESEPQYNFLRKIGCDVIQGNFMSPAMPFDELFDWLRQNRAVPPQASRTSDDNDSPSILLVDDEPNILNALSRLFRRDGYRIFTATNAHDAFEILAGNNVHVVISDQRMPEMSGTQFLARVKSIYPDTVRIVLSGYSDVKSVTEAINEGAIYRFETKPWNDEELRNYVRKAFGDLFLQTRQALEQQADRAVEQQATVFATHRSTARQAVSR